MKYLTPREIYMAKHFENLGGLSYSDMRRDHADVYEKVMKDFNEEKERVKREQDAWCKANNTTLKAKKQADAIMRSAIQSERFKRRESRVLAKWRRLQENDRTYYWNMKTDETSWSPPEGFAAPPPPPPPPSSVADEWKHATTPDGRKYRWNTKTGERVWEFD